jgi:hypothetical protein
MNIIMIIVLVLIVVIPVIIYILVRKASKDFKHYHNIKKEKRLMNEVMSSQDDDERKSLINTITLRQTLRKTLDERYKSDSIFDVLMKIIPAILTVGVSIGLGFIILSSFNKVVNVTSASYPKNVTNSTIAITQAIWGNKPSSLFITIIPTIFVTITVLIFIYWFKHILDWNSSSF